MRLIATCMAANEGDIIEAFARHNAGLLDALVVLDHASTDRTPAILESLIARKALIGWLAHRLAVPEGTKLASHWREIFAGIASGEIGIDANLARNALALYVGGAVDGRPRVVSPDELVADPLPCNYELRYTPAVAPAPVATLATWADQLVSDIKSGALAPRS